MTTVTGRPARLPRYVLGVEPPELRDPGNGGRITPLGHCYVRLVSTLAGGETRLLTDPIYVGQELDLYFETDEGAITVTADSAINQTGNNTLLFEDGGDHLRLVGGRDGAGDFEWRVLVNDGISLSTV